MKETAPSESLKRTDAHSALGAFVGRWRAEGWSYTGTDPNAKDPKQPRERWFSTISAEWHTGEFFLIQNEREYSGEDSTGVFETHSVFGVEPETGEWFVHTFENH